MVEKPNIHFPCPNCGGCGGQVVFVALSPEMLADPSIIRWDCHFCQPNPCRLAPSGDGTDGQ